MYPTLLHIGHLYLPTFGLLAALGLAAALWFSLRTARLAGVSADGLWDAGLFAVMAAFVSSRLLLVVFNLKSFLSAPILLLMVPSLTAMGLGLAAVAVGVYLWRKGMPVLRVLDAWAAPGALLWAFLAMGHLAEGSDPGLPSRLGLRTSLAGYREQPVALYAVVLAVVVAAWLYTLLKRQRAAGWVAGAGLVCVGLVQFGLTFLRMPYVYEPGFALAWLDPVQWVAVGMVGVGGALMVWRGGEDAGGPSLRPAAFGREDGSRGELLGWEDATVSGREDDDVRSRGEQNAGVSPLRPAAFGRDDGSRGEMPGRDSGDEEGVPGRGSGDVTRDKGRNAGVSPLRPAAFGRDDGSRGGVPGRDSGDEEGVPGRGSGDVTRDEGRNAGVSPLRPAAFGRDDGSRGGVPGQDSGDEEGVPGRGSGDVTRDEGKNAGVSPLRPAAFGRDDGSQGEIVDRKGMPGRDSGSQGGMPGLDDGDREGMPGLDDGSEKGVPGREDGNGEKGSIVHREHSMQAHQVAEQQVRRDAVRGKMMERES